MYIINEDYNKFLYQEDRYIITYDDDPTTLDSSELAAAEEMKSYLRAYRFATFDFDNIFLPISQYNVATPYQVGQIVWGIVLLPSGLQEFGIYTCVQLGTNKPLLDTDFWEKKDPRNPLIVMYMCDIVIYHLFAHIMPNNIPQIRIDRYKHALKWLAEVRDGKIDPALSIITPEPSEKAANAYTSHKNGTRKNYRY
jgi:hypothetical protein